MGFKVDGVGFLPNFQRHVAAKLRVGPQQVFQVQECARGPLSPCQVWLGSDFTRRRDGQKVEFLCVCLSVRHASVNPAPNLITSPPDILLTSKNT